MMRAHCRHYNLIYSPLQVSTINNLLDQNKYQHSRFHPVFGSRLNIQELFPYLDVILTFFPLLFVNLLSIVSLVRMRMRMKIVKNYLPCFPFFVKMIQNTSNSDMLIASISTPDIDYKDWIRIEDNLKVT